jgi:hypothetical protein
MVRVRVVDQMPHPVGWLQALTCQISGLGRFRGEAGDMALTPWPPVVVKV